eukprot:9478834-Pyramimonas_sp.AAC.1
MAGHQGLAGSRRRVGVALVRDESSKLGHELGVVPPGILGVGRVKPHRVVFEEHVAQVPHNVLPHVGSGGNSHPSIYLGLPVQGVQLAGRMWLARPPAGALPLLGRHGLAWRPSKPSGILSCSRSAIACESAAHARCPTCAGPAAVEEAPPGAATSPCPSGNIRRTTGAGRCRHCAPRAS